MLDSIRSTVVHSLVKHRWLWLFSSLLWAGILISGVRDLWINSSYKVFFDKDNPQLAALERLEDEYTLTDNVLFVLEPANHNIFSVENLQAIVEMTEAAWRLPFSLRVDSLANFQHSTAVGDELTVRDLVADPDGLDAKEVSRVRAIALSEPMLRNVLVSERGHVAGINVRIQLPENPQQSLPVLKELMAAAVALQNETQREHPGLKVHLMGQVAVAHTFDVVAHADTARFMPIMIALITLLTAFLLRSWAATGVTLLCVFLSIAVTLGLFGWLGFQLNQVGAIAPTIVLTVTVTDSMHIMVGYLKRTHAGVLPKVAMQEALTHDLGPMLMTSLTVAIGFFTLMSSDSPPFRELGLVVGIAIFLTFILTVVVGSALMPSLVSKGRGMLLHDLKFDRWARFIIGRQKPLFWVALLIAVACMLLATRNHLDDDTASYFSQKLPIRQAFDFTERNLNGTSTIEYSLKSGSPNGIHDPEYLKSVDEFVEWYRKQPDVTHVAAFTDVIKRLNRNMNGDASEAYRIPRTQQMAAQYELLYELSLPQGLDLNDWVTFDKSATRVVVSLRDVKSKDLLAVEDRAAAWLQKNASRLGVEASSISLMYAHMGVSNIYSMLEGATGGTLLILIAVIFIFRSVKYGLIAVVANTLPTIISFGVWAIVDGQVNLAVAAVFNISAGIVIDDTIHLMSNYLHARRRLGFSADEAILSAFSSAGTVVLVNTVILAAGFAVFMVSDFTVNRSLGVMMAMTIVFAAMYDLLFLPGLLLQFDKYVSMEPEAVLI